MRQGAIFCPTPARSKGRGLAAGPSLHDCKMSKNGRESASHIPHYHDSTGTQGQLFNYFQGRLNLPPF
jgi:hypothetical protein